MSCTVLIADDFAGAKWDSYIESCASPHHAYAWAWRQILHQVFRHKPYYLMATANNDNQKIEGILPLFYVKSFLFGKALISLPYLNAGGVLASSTDASLALLSQASVLATKLGVDYVELRQRQEIPEASKAYSLRQHKVSIELPLSANPDQIFKAFPSKLRSQIRRAGKDGLTAKISGLDLTDKQALDSFYQVFALHMRDLGTPVYPKSLFCLTKEYFADSCRIIIVWHGRLPVACGMTIGFNEHMEIPWACALNAYKSSAPNMLLYWQAIEDAALRGYKTFDFGRSSRDSGTLRFKEQWGGSQVPLYWYYLCEKTIPEVNPKSHRFAPFVSCWKHLPLAITNAIGPWLSKSIP